MSVLSELQAIEESTGILQPKNVVVWAKKHPKSDLYNQFDWDDKSAAGKYRIWQARQLIAIQITVMKGKKSDINISAFISLTSDRQEGGYRSMVSVLSDGEMREQMLMDAKAEMEVFKRKYKQLVELTKVFDAIDLVLK